MNFFFKSPNVHVLLICLAGSFVIYIFIAECEILLHLHQQWVSHFIKVSSKLIRINSIEMMEFQKYWASDSTGTEKKKGNFYRLKKGMEEINRDLAH